MPIFDYKDYGNPENVGDNPHSSTCLYCKSELSRFETEDIWQTDYKQLKAIHRATTKSYKDIHSLEDCDLNLNYEYQSTEVWINFCKTCGWWRIVKDISISAEEWQIWQIFFGVTGNLKNLDATNIDLQVEEIYNYLLVKYDSRFTMSPKLFEDVTASVFKNIGYQTLVTGYSHDDGIDIILEKDNIEIGVQVKRYKNKIKVEQIRAFTGALLLANLFQGIFVTTSEYQPGAYKAAKEFSRIGIPITLINVKQFYDALKIYHKRDFDFQILAGILKNKDIKKLFSYGWETPMNSM